jgi:hypothetical protein
MTEKTLAAILGFPGASYRQGFLARARFPHNPMRGCKRSIFNNLCGSIRLVCVG